MKKITKTRQMIQGAMGASLMGMSNITLAAPAASGGGAGAWTTFNESVPAWVTFAPNGMPILHSSPGSKAQVYMDFDGDPNRTGDDGNPVRAIDFDGDPDTFNAYEQQYIYNWWLATSAMYSMFDIDVTTEIDTNDPRSWNLISPSWNGGAAGFGSFGMTEGTSVISQGFGPYSTVIGHEGGHTFGLPHAINWDQYGGLTESYYGNPNNLRAAVMGSADNVQNKWYNKNHWGYDDVIFDDISQVISAVQHEVPSSPGYRPDDHPGTTAGAVALTAQGSGFRGEGIIEQMSDVDMFSFTWGGGRMSLHTAAVEISPVCLKLSVLDSNGDLVAHVDNGKNIQWLQHDLAAGSYYLKLESAGRYSDLGSYRVYIDEQPSNWYSQNVGNVRLARDNFYDSGTGEWQLDVASQDTWGSADSFMFTYQKLDGDGEIIAHVKSQEYVGSSWSKTGVMIRESLDHDSKHMFAMWSSSNGARMHSRSSTGGSSTDAAGGSSDRWVRLVRSGNTISSYSSSNGSSWTLISSQNIAMNQEVYIGLVNCSNNHQRASTAVFDNVTVTGNLVDDNPTLNSLTAPVGLVASTPTDTTVDLSWSAVPGATGYTVEGSVNGVGFEVMTTVDAATTSYQASGLVGGRLHLFRVRANDASGVSVASPAQQVITRPGPVTDLRLISLSTTTVVLDWEEPFGETGYRIERSLDGISYEVVGTAVQHGRKFVDTAAFSGLRYYYRVVTLDAQGDAAVAEIRRDADPLIDDDGSSGIIPWSAEVEFGTVAEYQQGSLAGNRTKPVDLSSISGDATYEFIVEASDDGQVSTELLSGNGYGLKFEQWNNRGVFGATQFGVADWSFTAESGQSVASPYGAVHQVAFTVDTTAGETRVYVDNVHVGTLNQTIDLGGGTATLGDGGLRSDGATGIHAFAAYNSMLSVAEMTAHKDAWILGTSSNLAPVVDDATLFIAENNLAGASVGTVVASDPNVGDGLSYVITAGNQAGLFAIDSNGEITVTGELNYEVVDSYALTVEVADSGLLTDTATITVMVSDVDESADGGVAAWEEAVYQGASSLMKRTDTLAGNTTASVDLSSISGDASYEFIIEGEDIGQAAVDILSGNGWGLKFEQWNDLGVLGVTQFGNADWSLTAEQGQSVNTPYGSLKHLVFAVDTSAAETRVFLDGVLVGKVAQIPDMGATSVTLGASNLRGDSAPGIHAFAAYNSVLDATEIVTHANAWFVTLPNNEPVAEDAIFAVAEHVASGTSVGTVAATDSDITDTMSYAISAGNSGGEFSINNATGEITTASALDYETTAQYVLTVTATDDGTPVLSDTATITVNVTDINEAPVANDTSGSVAENTDAGAVIATVVVSDVDAGDSHSYAITAGNTGNAFAIDSGGNITTTAPLDYETLASYTLTVTVTDSGLLTDTASVGVTVTDVVETTAPIIATGGASTLTQSSAEIAYTVSDDGGEAPTVTLYYGTGDGGNTPANWDNSVGQGAKATGGYSASLAGLTAGTTYYFTVHASNSTGESWGSSGNFTTMADTSPKLVRTTVSAVGNGSWTTVNLGQNYTSAVIIATPIYPNTTTAPVVTRITNVSGSSFDLKVDRADGLTDAISIDVSIIAVEEGVYTQATDGVTMEAVKYTSTVTAENNSWVGEARTYQNSYTDPVVVGQVMSANDSNWSVFWSMGSSRTAPASASVLNVGKHVGEDPNATRANETVGYMVIESGSGSVNGVAYEAALGADTVRGFGNSSSPYTYSLSGNLNSVSAAAASISGMDGGNGAWAVLSGSPAITTTNIGFHALEDQVNDTEQSHTTTQVGYIVFE